MWIRTDPATELLNALEHAAMCTRLARSDPPNWKWVVGALHSAAQVAMVITLDDAGVYEHLSASDANKKRNRPSSRERMRHFMATSRHDPAARLPVTKLASFTDLFASSVRYGPEHFGHLKERAALLNVIRNEWVHFDESSYLIHLSTLEDAARAGLEIVRLLPWRDQVAAHGPADAVARIEALIVQIGAALSAALMEAAGAPTDDDDARYAELEARLGEMVLYDDEERATTDPT
jgi:hypothetical protein